MPTIRLGLVEDNPDYVTEACAFLATVPHIEVVGVYATGSAAVTGIQTTRPDVALIDLQLADGHSGVDVIRQILADGGTTECVALTMYEDDAHLFPALRAGAVGYIVKGDTSLEELVHAIEAVIDGEAPMSMGIARRILQEFWELRPEERCPPLQGLTTRERETLSLLATGLTTRMVAAQLGISYATVRCHQKNIYRKLQVCSLIEAVILWQQAHR
jgi:DNA-binding NarL/FixJ family response regulator